MNIYKEESRGRVTGELDMESDTATDDFLEKQMETLENRIRIFLEEQAENWIEEECWMRVEAFKSQIMGELREEADKWVCEELKRRTAEFRKRTEEL